MAKYGLANWKEFSMSLVSLVIGTLATKVFRLQRMLAYSVCIFGFLELYFLLDGAVGSIYGYIHDFEKSHQQQFGLKCVMPFDMVNGSSHVRNIGIRRG
jgi:hypothetical protein